MTESNDDGKIISQKASARVLAGDEIAALDGDKVAAENSAAANRLVDGQLLVDVGKNLVPAERVEERVPLRRGDEAMPAAVAQHGDEMVTVTCIPSMESAVVVVTPGTWPDHFDPKTLAYRGNPLTPEQLAGLESTAANLSASCLHHACSALPTV